MPRKAVKIANSSLLTLYKMKCRGRRILILCVYVCMHVCLYVCMYVCMLCMYVCMYVCSLCRYVVMYVMYVFVMYVSMFYMYVCIYVCILCMYVCSYCRAASVSERSEANNRCLFELRRYLFIYIYIRYIYVSHDT